MTPKLVALRWTGAIVMAATGAAIIAAANTVSSGMAMAADREHPAVVELFQSQGCSSCPPANANVLALSERQDLLTLSFGVTYWDQLGWKDTFGSPQNTARQWDYAHAFHHDEVWTPQVIVNGRGDVVGDRRDEIEALIQRADRGAGGPSIVARGDTITVGSSPAGPSALVLLVRYDPNVVQVPISRGENGGRTLPHKNVVKELVKLGAWSGQAQSYHLPPAHVAGLKSAILVQAGPGGAIVSAARI